MKILIATNAMKGSLTATEFAEAVAKGLELASDSFQTQLLPIADGGDGTAEILVNHLKGEFIPIKVNDPLGRKIESRFGWISASETAIIELADASGLRLISDNEINPMETSSFGTGELIRAAVDFGAKKIILGLGGSATVDGGVGLMMALGARFTDAEKNNIGLGGKALSQISAIEIENFDLQLNDIQIDILTDVSNPLLGDNGAAKVFGPQKGATQKQVGELDRGLANLNQIVFQLTGKDFSKNNGVGAAGGTALLLIAFLNASLVPGSNYVLDKLGFDKLLEKSDLVITGEGSIDFQTLEDKGPIVVANRARALGIPVIALGGSVSSDTSKAFDGIFSIINKPMTIDMAMKNAYQLVTQNAYEIGKMIIKLKK